jgi:hypothetical protein
MTQTPGWLLPGFLTLVGLFAGILSNRWWARREAKARRRIPRHWPLNPRALANSQERQVWRWLIRVFFDHQVMVKVPITRFTLPRSKEESAHWYELLSGVYCTFTICNAEGRVVGCVDVPGAKGISRANMQLKLTLLTHCGIAYCVVQPNNLPTLEEIRTDVLGSNAVPIRKQESADAAIAAARQRLRTAVDRRRLNRASDEAPASGPTSSGLGLDSGFLPGDFAAGAWQQADSFIAPLDSRPGRLH